MLATLQPYAEKIQQQLREVELIDIGKAPGSHEQAVLTQQLHKILTQLSAGLSRELQQRLQAEFCAQGPLEELLCDETISEILINNWQEIWIEKNGQLEKHCDHFLLPQTCARILNHIIEDAQLKIDRTQPFADSQWRDFRLHTVLPPISPSPTLSLRRRSYRHWQLSDLQNRGMLCSEQKDLLLRWLAQRKNILIIGSTGAGKTTLLNACLLALPQNERVLVLEDSDELILPNPCSQKLLTRFDPQWPQATVALTDLVRQSLRMRPDRLALGEVRGGEAKDLLLALATGHSGSLCTLHADSAQQALIRLEMLVQLGAPQWDITAIRKLIHFSLGGIIQVHKRNGQRQITGFHLVRGIEEFGVLLEDVGN